MPRLLALLAGLALSVTASGAAPPRGVSPGDAHLYAATPFFCPSLTGLLPVPPARINDGYCDCVDGSDEPGTAACANGQFYCINAGHVPKTLNSSFVDDGVCDCCDGSDEPDGACPDICAATGAAARAAAAARLAAVKEGATARAAAVAKAVELKAAWAADAAAKQKAAKVAAAKAEALKPAKEAAEKAERKAREAAARVAARAAKAEEEKEGVLPPQPPAKAEAPEEAPAPEATTPSPPPTEAKAEEDPDEVGRRIAAQWTHDPAAAGPAKVKEEAKEAEVAAGAGAGTKDPVAPAPAADASSSSSSGGEDINVIDLDADAGVETGTAGESGAAEAGAAPQPLTSRLTAGLSWLRSLAPGALSARSPSAAAAAAAAAVSHAASDKAIAARNALSEAEKAAKEAETAAKGAALKVALDLGPPDSAFAPLVGRCFNADVDKYTYQVCPFDDAAQKEIGGSGGATDLGDWAGWGEKGNVSGGHPLVMRFEGGSACWNGPARSMTVTLVCGPKEVLHTVTEPSRCAYAAVLEAPAACDAGAVAAAEAAAAAAGAVVGEKKKAGSSGGKKDEL